MRKYLILLLFVSSCFCGLSAQDKAAPADGQRFMTTKESTMYKYPFVTSEIKGTLPAGTEVVMVDHDPNNMWARVRFYHEDGSGQDYFIDLRNVDFPGSQIVTIPANIQGGRHDGKDTIVHEKKKSVSFGTKTQKKWYYVLFYLIAIPSILYRVFRRWLVGKEMVFMLLTIACAALFLTYLFGSQARGIQLEDSTNFWYMLCKVPVMIFVLYCAWSLIKWAWRHTWDLWIPNDRSFISKLKNGIPSVLFLLTMIFMVAQAANAILLFGIVALGVIGFFVHEKRPTLNEAFWDAFMNGQFDEAEKLLKQGANINAFMPSGLTPLMAMVRRGVINYTQWLLEKGADPNVRDKDGNTALLHSALTNHGEAFVDILMKYGVDVNVVNNRGKNFAALCLRNINEKEN